MSSLRVCVKIKKEFLKGLSLQTTSNQRSCEEFDHFMLSVAPPMSNHTLDTLLKKKILTQYNIVLVVKLASFHQKSALNDWHQAHQLPDSPCPWRTRWVPEGLTETVSRTALVPKRRGESLKVSLRLVANDGASRWSHLKKTRLARIGVCDRSHVFCFCPSMASSLSVQLMSNSHSPVRTWTPNSSFTSSTWMKKTSEVPFCFSPRLSVIPDRPCPCCPLRVHVSQSCCWS